MSGCYNIYVTVELGWRVVKLYLWWQRFGRWELELLGGCYVDPVPKLHDATVAAVKLPLSEILRIDGPGDNPGTNLLDKLLLNLF